jgi:hypothetical protein
MKEENGRQTEAELARFGAGRIEKMKEIKDG